MANKNSYWSHRFPSPSKSPLNYDKDDLVITVYFYGNRHPLVIRESAAEIKSLIEHYRQSEYVRMIDCEEAEAEIVRRALTRD